MTTKLIGLKDFRQNLATYTKNALKADIRYIVLKKNVPVLEVKAVDEKEFAMEKLKKDIAVARRQISEGKFYTQEEIMKEFGLL